MKNKKTTSVLSAGFVLGALVLAAFAPVGAVYAQSVPTVDVIISNYIDGAMATATSANSASFGMNAAWTADNLGTGSGQYDLSLAGSAPDNTPYEAETVEMSSGADYSTSEIMDGTVVGATCSTTSDTTTPAYTLAGYTTGATLAAAAAATPTMTAPSFTNLTDNEYVIVWNTTCAPVAPAVPSVTIAGYVNGVLATEASTNNATFTMNASFNDINVGSGTNQEYFLSSTGFQTPTPYEASTGSMTSGSSYATNEVMDGTTVGATCSTTSATPAYTLAGYSMGDTLAAAALATPSMTAPSFTNLTDNEYVIVWNTSCAPNTTTTAPSVTVAGYVNGVLATATSANNANFQMNATWNTTNIASGTGTYALSATGFNTPTAYEASTGTFNSGATYTTNEVMDGTTVGATCSTTSATPAYTLAGYSMGDTLAAAALATPSMTAPSFTNLTAPEFVIVWNTACTPTTTTTGGTGTIGGTVIGGVVPGALAVTSITPVNTTATADGTFTNGWKYLFNITVPTNEPNLSMEFGDWTDAVDGSTIPAANDIRISSLQANNADATIPVTASNTFTAIPLDMTTDLSSTIPGMQVQVLVETAVPLNSVNGSYTTNFGVQTLP